MKQSLVKSYWSKFRPSDKLIIFWALASLGMVYSFLPGYLVKLHVSWWQFAVPHTLGVLALLVLLPATRTSQNRLVIFLRSWYPVLVMPLLYRELFYLVPAVNPNDVDLLLMKVEQHVFGTSPTLWLDTLYSPVLTDILFLAYAAFFFLPLVPAAPLYYKGDLPKFDRFVFLILLNYFTAFSLYFVMPSVGPHITLAGQYLHPLKGVLVSEWIFNTLKGLMGIQHDCFPSLHTQLSFVILGYLYKSKDYTFRFTLPLGAAIVFATIYCRYHYVPDLVAGLTLGTLTLVLYKKLYRKAGGGLAEAPSLRRQAP